MRVCQFRHFGKWRLFRPRTQGLRAHCLPEPRVNLTISIVQARV